MTTFLEARQRETREQLEKARRERREQEEATLKRRYLAAGGDENGWLRERESILAEARRASVLSGDEIERRSFRRRYS